MTPPPAANRRGIAAMAAGMACFLANDSLVKYVSQSLPAAQLILVRGLFATAVLAVMVQAMGLRSHVPALRNRRVALRAAFDAFATCTYLVSLFHMPLANATAINNAAPLFITTFAVVAFHERVGLGRWLAVLTGFAGVLLIVQPTGAAFNAYALLCVAGTMLNSARDLMTRMIDRSIPSLVLTLSTAIGVTLFAAAWSLFIEWKAMQPLQLLQLAGASVFLCGGYFFLTVAMRSGEMSVVAPFRYTGLLLSLVVGYFVWGDVPNAWAWGGIVLLVAAGLYVLHSGGRPRPAGA